MLTEREKKILDCIVEIWIETDAPMFGDVSYAEVSEVLVKLQLNNADNKLKTFIERYESL